MLPRFLCPDLDAERGVATLEGGEAHHLLRVLRLAAGDEIAIFDGRGREFTARIDRVSGQTVALTLREPVTTPARAVQIALAQAVLKGQGMDDVVRDAVMMGVSRIVPLVTAHTVAHKAASGHGAERWRRVALASAKQSRTARLPDVTEPMPFGNWVGTAFSRPGLLLVEPSVPAVQPLRVRELASAPQPQSATLIIGPEGGWSPEEVRSALEAGCTPVTLGPLTLRAESAALAALAAVSVVWE